MLNAMQWSPRVIIGCLLLILGVGVSVAIAGEEAVVEEQTEATGASMADEEKALDGAKVYAWSCGSCHSERRPKERSDAEWEVITTHMRVRANMTGEQSEAVLSYLQENN